jgi:hypothetical protein
MPNITWTIEQNWVKPVEGSETDVVVTSTYRCKANETVDTGDNSKTYIATVDGSCSFAPPSGSFTPYADLTQQQVLDWCFANGVDKTAIEANVTAQIQNQINPPVVSLPLPWIEVVPPLVEQRIPVLQPHQIVDPFTLPTSDVPPSVDGMTNTILG